MTHDWRKSQDFAEYVKRRKLLYYTPPWARNSSAAKKIQLGHQETIDRLEAQYPDFSEAYTIYVERKS
ncbi:hypothetical protein PHIM7_350 [Sinorhizobium phage phiM7]|uniref:Uncharacterized protein n=2 Tax=Emdodecavirus TaxID=1980937 RepID=S5MBT6_9CAUD|nr:hypothetical protein AB690_gp165 [Sinorhizobium phage phiM12]YP_009601475.1 hypothetical protein FDH46_gp128 [Sinorhizobium phage phiM7]AGR48083.1 hypothetical protein SmphiM12_451 [Sinorhizobium phage phiM12]AKF12895.1 hypothetical protein PHIM7_350 [Sinorhizobium phage phiM7]AKF13255.1 hypothetical protein PHIM19_350 [Sinorhizobium phage phiM19]